MNISFDSFFFFLIGNGATAQTKVTHTAKRNTYNILFQRSLQATPKSKGQQNKNSWLMLHNKLLGYHAKSFTSCSLAVPDYDILIHNKNKVRIIGQRPLSPPYLLPQCHHLQLLIVFPVPSHRVSHKEVRFCCERVVV